MSLSDKPIEIVTKIVIFTFEKSRGELLVKELTEAYANSCLYIFNLYCQRYFNINFLHYRSVAPTICANCAI